MPQNFKICKEESHCLGPQWDFISSVNFVSLNMTFKSVCYRLVLIQGTNYIISRDGCITTTAKTRSTLLYTHLCSYKSKIQIFWEKAATQKDDYLINIQLGPSSSVGATNVSKYPVLNTDDLILEILSFFNFTFGWIYPWIQNSNCSLFNKAIK